MHRPVSRLSSLRATICVAALGATVTSVLVDARPLAAEPSVVIDRVEASESATTARLAAGRVPPSDTVLLARVDVFADALAASYLAGQLDAPILYTSSVLATPDVVAAIDERDAERVIVLGGTAAISETVVDQLTTAGFDVDRIGGADRYETARLVAAAGTTVGVLGGRRTALVASGANFPDALAGGALAYGAALPLLLTDPAAVPTATRQAITALGITNVVLLGGPAAVSEAVRTELEGLGLIVTRVFGIDRYETATQIAEFARTMLGWPHDSLVLATGLAFPDAEVAGPLAGARRAPLLLTGTELPGSTAAACATYAGTVDSLLVVSTDGAVSDPAVQRCRIASEGDAASGWTRIEPAPNDGKFHTGEPQLTRSSSGEGVRTKFFGSGSTEVYLDGVGRGDGFVHVTPATDDRSCGVLTFGADGDDALVRTLCRTGFGTNASAPVSVFYLQAPSVPPVGRLGYATVTDPLAPGVLRDNYQYNSASAANRFERVTVGSYIVIFNGLAGTGGTIMMGDNEGLPLHCAVTAWDNVDTDLRVHVSCIDIEGKPTDTALSVLFGEQSTWIPPYATKSGYAFVDKPTLATSTPDPDHQYNSAGAINTVARSSAGVYTVRFDDLAPASGLGNVQLTMHGVSRVTCGATSWGPSGPDVVVEVKCRDNNGDFVDSRFLVQYVG